MKIYLIPLAVVLMSSTSQARVSFPKIPCATHESSMSVLPGEIEQIYNAHFYRSPEGKDTQEIIERTGKYSATGLIEYTLKNGKIRRTQATLFNNCLVVVSRHGLEEPVTVGVTEGLLLFGAPKRTDAFPVEVKGTVYEIPPRPDVPLVAGDTRDTASDLVVLKVEDEKECQSLKGLTPAKPFMGTAEDFVSLSSGNSSEYELITTRKPHELDSKKIKNSKEVAERKKSLKETCGVNKFYTESHPDVPGGTVVFHNCSSVPGSSGGPITLKTDDKHLVVGSIHKGALAVDGIQDNVLNKYGDVRDFEIDDQNAHSSAFIGVISDATLKLMAGD